jgi:large subunit ribosomal protein L4e
MAAARPLISVQGSDDAKQKQIVMPAVMLAPIRPDIVHFVHMNMDKNKRQAYAVKHMAGHGHSAASWGTGRAVSRIPRVSGGGTSRAGQGAFGNMCRKGRMFAPTKTWRKWHRKINTNQKRYAVASALAASAVPALVMARGHRIAEVPELPLVVDDSVESTQKTSAAVALLKSVGAYDDVLKAKASRNVRRGKGKMRNRRHVARRGPLIVYNEDNGITKAFRNLAGVEVCQVERLNLLQVAPGGHVGRFIVWTRSALQALNGLWGSDRRQASKKGYHLPRNLMSTTDISRIINSDEVQSHVRAANNVVVRAQRKKNPLKNLGVKVKLNPYALSLRRSELLAQEARAAAKAKRIEEMRNKAPVSLSASEATARANRKTHAPRQPINYLNLVEDGFEAPDKKITKKAPVFTLGASGSLVEPDLSVPEQPVVFETKGSAKKESKAAAPAAAASAPAGTSFTVSCSKLIAIDWLSKSDPAVKLFKVEGKKETLIGATEWLKNNHEPKFATKITCTVDTKAQYRISVFDCDEKPSGMEEEFMGSANVSGADLASGGSWKIINTKKPKLNRKLKKSGSTVTFTC